MAKVGVMPKVGFGQGLCVVYHLPWIHSQCDHPEVPQNPQVNRKASDLFFLFIISILHLFCTHPCPCLCLHFHLDALTFRLLCLYTFHAHLVIPVSRFGTAYSLFFPPYVLSFVCLTVCPASLALSQFDCLAVINHCFVPSSKPTATGTALTAGASDGHLTHTHTHTHSLAQDNKPISLPLASPRFLVTY